jgi:hypothetical protein
MTFTMQTRLSAKDRMMNFLSAWRVADNDTDIDVRIGSSTEGIPAVLISIGQDMHAFTADEADIVAKSARSSLRKFGQAAVDEGLDNLILALQIGSQAARDALRIKSARIEQHHPDPQSEQN